MKQVFCEPSSRTCRRRARRLGRSHHRPSTPHYEKLVVVFRIATERILIVTINSEGRTMKCLTEIVYTCSKAALRVLPYL